MSSQENERWITEAGRSVLAWKNHLIGKYQILYPLIDNNFLEKIVEVKEYGGVKRLPLIAQEKVYSDLDFILEFCKVNNLTIHKRNKTLTNINFRTLLNIFKNIYFKDGGETLLNEGKAQDSAILLDEFFRNQDLTLRGKVLNKFYEPEIPIAEQKTEYRKSKEQLKSVHSKTQTAQEIKEKRAKVGEFLLKNGFVTYAHLELLGAARRKFKEGQDGNFYLQEVA